MRVIPRLGLLGLLFVACEDPQSEARVEGLVVDDVAAYWAVRGQDAEKNHYIHPVIRFRIGNHGSEEVGYVQAMAVFKRESFPDEPWGNAFIYSISEAQIPPGGTSDLLTLRCDTNFVSKDTPEQMFDNEKWEKVWVEVFLRAGPSSWKLALTEEIPKRIGAPGLDKFISP